MISKMTARKEHVSSLLDIRVVGKSKYIMMNYKTCTEEGKFYKCWRFFNLKSG